MSCAPGAEDDYATRLIVCHGCAARQKREQDLQEDSAEAGAMVLVEHRPRGDSP